MSETETLVVYLEIERDADADTVAEQVRAAVAGLPEVGAADVEVEDVERSAADVAQTITVTLTAATGAVGAANVLLLGVTALIRSAKGVRAAWRGTDDGPVPIDATQDAAAG